MTAPAVVPVPVEAPFDFLEVLRREVKPGKLLAGMVRIEGHPVGSRWLYEDRHFRSLGESKGFEEYLVVTGCVVERITHTRNFPDVPVHIVTLDNGSVTRAQIAALTAYEGPAFAEGDCRVPLPKLALVDPDPAPDRAPMLAVTAKDEAA